MAIELILDLDGGPMDRRSMAVNECYKDSGPMDRCGR